MLFSFVVVIDVITDFTTIVGGSATLYVNETGTGGAFTSIQDAINAANPGDTVYVYSGTYFEKVVVNKMINLTGEDRNSTIINGGGTGTVVYVTTDWVNITSFTITNGIYGLYLDSLSNNNIINNNVSNNGDGIYLYYSNGNKLSGNNVYSNNDRAIYLFLSSNNTITNNNISSNNKDGICLSSSSNNTITGNNVSSNSWYGIIISWSSNNTLISNNFINDGLFIVGWYLWHYNSHNISKSVNIDGIPVGQIILANCTDFNIKNLQIDNTDVGIEVAYSTNTLITDNTATNNFEYIYLIRSSNNNITNNNIKNDNIPNNHFGIRFLRSTNNNVINNNISHNYWGIRLYLSSNNNIINNNFLNNEHGILLQSSSNNSIIRNNASNNNDGILLESYLEISSNNNTVTNNNVSFNSGDGIYILNSNWNDITGNNVSNNFNGIHLDESLNTNITDNMVLSSNYYGIYLDSSSNNIIYHNNIIKNANQAYDNMDDNLWNDTYPAGGNYWSDFDESTDGAYDDYKGQEQNVVESDGIVDNGTIGGGGKNPYIIDADSQDNYPLIYPIGNYVFLYEGWNLISIPFIQSDTNLSSVLTSITGTYKAVQWYNATDSNDHWKHNSISKPSELNDLDSINHKMGFWIYITTPGGVLFQYFGIQPPENQSTTLYPAWNLTTSLSVMISTRSGPTKPQPKNGRR
jgi:parallel beta-helix repeat protein